MTRKIILGVKDDNGIYTKVESQVQVIEPVSQPIITDISIDNLMHRGLRAIYGLMKAIENDINTGAPSRETVQNLKDALTMLKDLKKDEKDLLDSMTDEQLEKLSKK